MKDKCNLVLYQDIFSILYGLDFLVDVMVLFIPVAVRLNVFNACSSSLICNAWLRYLLEPKRSVISARACSGGTRNFLWLGIEGTNCLSEGAKIKKNCRKWLIFAIFPFWLGESGGQSLGGGGQIPLMPPWCRHCGHLKYIEDTIARRTSFPQAMH